MFKALLLASAAMLACAPAWADQPKRQPTRHFRAAGPGPIPPSYSPVTSTGGNTPRTLANSTADFYNVISSGAVCDGTTDDTTALQAAFNSGNKRITGPSAKCRTTATVTIPTGVTFEGLAANSGNAPTGFTIYADPTVTPVVNIGSGGNNGQTFVSKLIASHSGTPASTTIGIQVNNGYNVTVIDSMSYNSGICWQWTANSSTGNGISGNMTRDYAGNCQDVMVFDSGWPELRITDGRYGMNGTNAYTANAYVRISGGGTASGASAPNTVYIDGGQYNGGAVHFMEFVNLGGPVPGTDATDFKVTGAHIETVTGAYFYSDSTWNEIDKLSVVNDTMNSNVPCFALDPGTQPIQLLFTNNQSACSDVTLTGQISQSLSSIIIDTNNLYGTGGTASIVLVGVAGSTVEVAHNSVANGINLSGTWGHLSVGPNIYVGGAFTDTSTGFGRTYFERTDLLLADSGTTPIPFTIDGSNPGGGVEEDILNNNSSSNSIARLKIATAIASANVLIDVLNANVTTPTADITAGSGIVGAFTIKTNASGSNIVISPNATTTATFAPSATTLVGTLTDASLSTVGTIAGSICATSAGLILYEAGATGCTISLEEIKHDILPVDPQVALHDVMALTPIAFNFNDPSIPDRRYGFGARQVNGVDPLLSTHDGNGDLQAYDPNGILANLVSVVQQQQKRIEALEAQH